ncbi:MAG: hypothetical protein M3198_18235 [Actinomycetota bacterium]|nr:hypothetical protein [Actinomycetota bacterium]
MLDRLLDLRGTLRALARQWVPVLVLAAWGMASGVGLTLAQEPTFVSSSLVLLPPSAVDAEGHKLRDMETEVYIARSPEVLDRAGSVVAPPIESEALRRQVRVRPVTDGILEIRAAAGSPDAARRLADAIAGAYVAYSQGTTSEQAGAAIPILQERATELEEQIRALEAEIAANKTRLAGQNQLSPDALRLAALTDSLRSEQVELARELSSLDARMADARLESAMAGQGTRVLQAAEEPARPARPRPVRNIAMGGLVGLATGAALGLVRKRRDRRLRSRDEIAEATGAAVVATVGVPHCSGVGDCRALLEGWVPNSVESLALRQALMRLGISEEKPPVNLVVVTLAGDQSGPLLAFELAATAAGTRTSTAFVVASEDASAAPLRAACNAVVTGGRALRSDLLVFGNASEVEEHDLVRAELTVTVVVAGAGPLTIPTWGRQTLTALAVSSGFATAESLASAALACLDAGHPVAGTMIANADPSDQTTGRLEMPQRTTRVREGELAQAAQDRDNGGLARAARLGAMSSDRDARGHVEPVAMPRTSEVLHELIARLPPGASHSEAKPRARRSPPSSSTGSKS